MFPETCPCEKYLTTNWYMLPPYTNRTGDQETGILPWLLNNLVEECCADCSNGHGWSEILYKTDGYGQDGYKEEIGDFSKIINIDTDFSFPILGHHLQEKFQTFYSYVYAVASPGVAFFIVDDPPEAMPNAILETVSGSWGMMLFTMVFSFMAGIIMWVLVRIDVSCSANYLKFKIVSHFSNDYHFVFYSSTGGNPNR